MLYEHARVWPFPVTKEVAFIESLTRGNQRRRLRQLESRHQGVPHATMSENAMNVSLGTAKKALFTSTRKAASKSVCDNSVAIDRDSVHSTLSSHGSFIRHMLPSPWRVPAGVQAAQSRI